MLIYEYIIVDLRIILFLCISFSLLSFKKLLTISYVASVIHIPHKIKPKAKLFFILLLFEDISKAAENSATKAESDEGKENDADEEKEAAATKIQAAFRGHHARKSLRVSETASKETRTAEKSSESTEEPTQEQLQEEFRADDQGERVYILI